MNMQKLVVLNECGFNEKQKQLLSSKVGVAVFYKDTDSEDLAIKRTGDADVVIIDQFILTFGEKFLKACPNLKTIIVNTTAFDKIDTNLLKKYGVRLRNLPAYATEDVAETALSMVLQLNQRTQVAQELVAKGVNDLFPGHPEEGRVLRSSIKGQFALVIGWGKIGRRVGKALRLLGVKVEGVGRKNIASLDLIDRADIVIISMAYQPESNDKIIGADILESMKPDAILVSIAPSELVDIDWLILHPDKFAGIGFDYLVTDKIRKLLEVRKNNIIVTPHLGSQSKEALKKMTESLISASVEEGD